MSERDATLAAGRGKPPSPTRSRRPARASARPVASAASEADAAGVPGADSPLFVNAVEKAMRVLLAFDGTQRHLTLSEIAALTRLDLSAAQRFSYTLVALGYLRKDERTRKYELSPRLLTFTTHFLASSELMGRANPYLQQLARQTEEAVNLTLLDSAEIVFVQRIVSRHVLDAAFLVGSRLPAYATAPGLAMLATLPDEEVDALLTKLPPVAHTRHTITGRAAIHARLREIRKHGYAHTREEYFLGDFSVAVAIPDGDGRASGAINVAIAKSRWRGAVDERRLAHLLLDVRRAMDAARTART